MESIPFPLQVLNDDLLIVVFEHLMELSPNTMNACTSVCHRFYRLALPIKYREVTVSNAKWCTRSKRLGNAKSQIPLFVRKATLDDHYSYGSGDTECLSDFVRAAKHLERIAIYGSYKFSQKLLDEIDTLLPNIWIDYHAEYPREEDGIYEGWGSRPPTTIEMNGFYSRRLRSLRIDTIWCSTVEQDVAQCSLEKIIKHSPNLRHLTSWSSFVHNLNLPDLDFSFSDRLPKLETYEFIPLSLETVRTWGRVTGWQDLKTLKIVFTDYVPIFVEAGVPNVEVLTLACNRKASVYDALPELRAPVRVLSISLDEDQVPLRFLAQFTNTLEELMLRRKREPLPGGFSTTDIRAIRETCPGLKKLYIRPYIDGDTPEWPHGILDEISRFESLQTLVLGVESYRREGRAALEPTSELCQTTYKAISSSNASRHLQELALVSEYEAESCDNFPQLLERAGAITVAPEGKLRVKKPYYSDYNVGERCRREAQLRSMAQRPFSRRFSDPPRMVMYEFKVGWAANMLGHEWAVKELLPEGLLRQEDLDKWMGDGEFEKALKRLVEKEGLEEVRGMMKEELRGYWKGVRERKAKHGEYHSLYDILYPRTDLS